MMLPSHADDNAVGVSCPRRDVDAKLCWGWCGRVMLATAVPG
jgi:hypothetical protein